MKTKLESSQNKTGRYRYFQILIKITLTSQKANLWIHANALIAVLVSTQLVPQVALEEALFRLQILDRGRQIQLSNFSSQLERDNQGLPYWNILLETTSLTSGPSIARAISKKLFPTENAIDPRIKIYAMDSFGELKKEERFPLKDSEWHPGYFTKTTLILDDLLAKEEVRESIKAAPDKYKILTKDLWQ
jgi:hypothetical protein